MCSIPPNQDISDKTNSITSPGAKTPMTAACNCTVRSGKRNCCGSDLPTFRLFPCFVAFPVFNRGGRLFSLLMNIFRWSAHSDTVGCVFQAYLWYTWSLTRSRMCGTGWLTTSAPWATTRSRTSPSSWKSSSASTSLSLAEASSTLFQYLIGTLSCWPKQAPPSLFHRQNMKAFLLLPGFSLWMKSTSGHKHERILLCKGLSDFVRISMVAFVSFFTAVFLFCKGTIISDPELGLQVSQSLQGSSWSGSQGHLIWQNVFLFGGTRTLITLHLLCCLVKIFFRECFSFSMRMSGSRQQKCEQKQVLSRRVVSQATKLSGDFTLCQLRNLTCNYWGFVCSVKSCFSPFLHGWCSPAQMSPSWSTKFSNASTC